MSATKSSHTVVLETKIRKFDPYIDFSSSSDDTDDDSAPKIVASIDPKGKADSQVLPKLSKTSIRYDDDIFSTQTKKTQPDAKKVSSLPDVPKKTKISIDQTRKPKSVLSPSAKSHHSSLTSRPPEKQSTQKTTKVNSTITTKSTRTGESKATATIDIESAALSSASMTSTSGSSIFPSSLETSASLDESLTTLDDEERSERNGLNQSLKISQDKSQSKHKSKKDGDASTTSKSKQPTKNIKTESDTPRSKKRKVSNSSELESSGEVESGDGDARLVGEGANADRKREDALVRQIDNLINTQNQFLTAFVKAIETVGSIRCRRERHILKKLHKSNEAVDKLFG